MTLLVSGWPGGESQERVDGMKVIRVGGRYSFPLHAWRRWLAELRHEPFDLVVEDVNKFPLFTPLWSGPPVVLQVPHLFGSVAFRQESWPVAAGVWAGERLMPLVYRKVRIHATSRSTAEDLAARGFPRENIRVIQNGVDHSFFYPDGSVERAAEPTFAYVGRLKLYKEMDVVLEALARLADRGVPARLKIAGKGDDRPRLEARTRELDLEDRVEFLGYVSEERKRHLLRTAWATVYPSPKEGWGITNIEAAACGTPAVASDSPGLRDSVVDGVSGLLVPHGDREAWASALERLATDPGYRDRLADGARRHAQEFSWERAAEETETDLLRTISE